MGYARFAAGASLAALGLMLGACGGGGVNSTPTPTPTGGTPTPTPTAGTPTPTPSTGTNDDLLTPLASENFVNDGVSGSANYPKNGSPGTNSAAFSSIGVVYDASAKRYTITGGGKSQSFGASDRDAAQSNALIDVYVRKSGNTTDSLTMTRPGTSGRMTYRYVGAGFWQRTVESNSAISGTFDAFTYGVETPDANMPHSGKGNFTTDMLGVIAYYDNLVSFSGEGVLGVDFGTGKILLSGEYTTIEPGTGVPHSPVAYDGEATLTSNTNEFTGRLFIFPMYNQLKGRFYGPGADELGAVFVGSDTNITIMGTLTGRRAEAGGNPGLDSLTGEHAFTGTVGPNLYPRFWANGWTVELDANGRPVAVPGTYIGGEPDAVTVNFTSGSYAFAKMNEPLVTFTSADRVAGQSNASFSAYRRSSGSIADELHVSNPGASNPTIALSYLSFGSLTHSGPASTAGHVASSTAYFIYGMPISSTIFPTTGSANYRGILYGSGASFSGGNNSYAVSGNFNLTANFASMSVTGDISPVLTNDASGQVLSLASFGLNGSIDARVPRPIAASFSGAGVSSSYFRGNFFGPAANEIGADFGGRVTNPFDGAETIAIMGVAVGKQ
ncbi:transferrin-binding protein-like solute binding protein [Altererythrobacter fulvus]|uniref:transferrin-binding protein-like solute binding protein n=1 Tax=Caenibius fulvus TaxID=2126012 RepID=UPI003017D85C